MRILKRFAGAGFIMCGLLVFSQCSRIYEPVFEQITEDKIRVISTVYTPSPDVSPGDTVGMTIHFAGDPVMRIRDMQISYDHVTNAETLIDRMPLQTISTQSHLPDSYSVEFVIPDTILADGSDAYNHAKSLCMYVEDSLDGDYNRLTSAQTDSLESIISRVSALYKWSMISMHAESKSGKTLEVWSNFLVRYNRKIPIMKANENPPIEWIGIYMTDLQDSTTKSINSFERAGHTFHYLYNANQPQSLFCEVSITDDSLFYLAAGTFDSKGMRRSSPKETADEWLVYTFFYQMDNTTFADPDSAIKVDNSGDDLVKFLPPITDHDMAFRIWAVVYDALPGVIRPRAFNCASGDGVFIVKD